MRERKRQIHILSDGYYEHPHAVLRQVKKFRVKDADLNFVAQPVERVVEFAIRPNMLAVQYGSDVFPDNDFRLDVRNEPDIVPHKAGTGAGTFFAAFAEPCYGKVLTRRTAHDKVNIRRQFCIVDSG